MTKSEKKMTGAATGPVPGKKRQQDIKGKTEELRTRGRRIRNIVGGIIFIALGLFFLLCFQTPFTGNFGTIICRVFMGCFGMVAYALPYLLLAFGVLIMVKATIHVGLKFILFLFFIYLMLAFINSGRFIDVPEFRGGYGLNAMKGYYRAGINLNGGGLIGMCLGSLLVKLLGIKGLYIFSAVVIAVFLVLIINTPVSRFFERMSDKRRWKRDEKEERELERQLEEVLAGENAEKMQPKDKMHPGGNNSDEKRPLFSFKKRSKNKALPAEDTVKTKNENLLKTGQTSYRDGKEDCAVRGQYDDKDDISHGQKRILDYVKSNDFNNNGTAENGREFSAADETDGSDTGCNHADAAMPAAAGIMRAPDSKQALSDYDDCKSSYKTGYKFPPLSLLHRSPKKKGMSTKAEIRSKAEKLEETLRNFNVPASVVDVTQGPAVTRYEVQPDVGVKVNGIVRLADDIALNMEAKSIRIEAPIPGKKAVGIELENETGNMVTIRDIISSEEFRKAPSKISFAVGRDISGKPIVADLNEMPHLLIAGATGSGKSVCVNSIITSILYRARPEEVKMILVDPKVVELTNYNGIPHLLIPVVTEPVKAAAALNWACAEMDDRYRKFAAEGVKKLESYNRAAAADKDRDPLPRIVIIIDELADLMTEAPSQVEESICRLAQKARAAGMHLIVATQRPSVDVITGLIKANIPSRIAFTVSSQVDSRTILDMAGAEKLVGKGDMLFSRVSDNKPHRVQGAFISEDEVNNVIAFVKSQAPESEYSNDLMHSMENTGKSADRRDDDDELLSEAVETVVSAGQGSTSMLQRRFRIGYNRAARMMDIMEKRGIVGPAEGSRPRQVLITEDRLKDTAAGDENAEGTDEPRE